MYTALRVTVRIGGWQAQKEDSREWSQSSSDNSFGEFRHEGYVLTSFH
jgi:hypothetical protein